MSRRVLLLGATGVFGRRLAQCLSGLPDTELVVASRRIARATALARELEARGVPAAVSATDCDLGYKFDDALAAIAPAITVNCAGPYQRFDTAAPRQVLDAGSHYIDLADARDYVRHFVVLDLPARERGLAAITGASTVPGLSSSVVAALAEGLADLQSVDVAISPGNRAPISPAVVQSVLSYAGEPFRRREGGAEIDVHGLGDLGREHILGVGRRWVSSCEVPDLDLFPVAYPDIRSVRVRAGMELSALHLPLWVLANLRRVPLLPRLRRFADPMWQAAQWLRRWGSDVGGMVVRVRGLTAERRRVERAWHLAAHDGHGPTVPVLPAFILVRRLLSGTVAPGARACFNEFSLDEFNGSLSGLNISTKTVEYDRDL